MARDDPSATFSARPTIRIGGQQLPALSANIASFSMCEAQGGMSSLELSLHDVLSFPDGSAGFGGTAASPLQLGAEIAVYMGNTVSPQEIFSGLITALEAEAGPATAPLFTILAEDKLFKLRRARKSRIFDDQTPAEVVRAVASDHSLQVQIDDGFETPVTSWVQMNETDLAFLRRIFASLDADLQLTGTNLQIVPLVANARANVALAMGSELLRIRTTADLANQITELRVGAFDPVAGEDSTATASSGRMGPGRGRDGASLLRPVTGEVREHIGHLRPMASGHTQKMADAAFGQKARSFVRADGTAQGNGAIRVGSWLDITGINPFFVNSYNVIEATHRFDLDQGYMTDFIAECAYLGAGA